jgi:hypothetical protein
MKIVPFLRMALILSTLVGGFAACDPFADKTVVHHFVVWESHKEVAFYTPDVVRSTAGPAQSQVPDGKIVLFDDNTGYCTSIGINGHGSRQPLTYTMLWATGRIRLEMDSTATRPARSILLEPLPTVPPGPAFWWNSTEDLGYDGTGTRSAVEVRLLLEDKAQ